MEQKIYKEIRPAVSYDVAAHETWLEDMARQGFRLVSFRGFSGVFERTAPAQCRYRLEPLLKKEARPEGEKVELYRAMEWTYVATMKNTFHIWRCDNPAARELDTDPVV